MTDEIMEELELIEIEKINNNRLALFPCDRRAQIMRVLLIQLRAQQAELAAMKAENKELRLALEPFAMAHEIAERDDVYEIGNADLRRAAQALESTERGERE